MKRNKLVTIIALILMSISGLNAQSNPQPKRIILFLIDGLHWQAPQKANMPVFNTLIKEGTYIKKSYTIVPHHPTIGDYSTFNSCSFPNPVLHSGTIFIKPENKYIQEVFKKEQKTAFIVNTNAYRSVARGFTTCIMDNSLSDGQVVEQSINIIETQDPTFIRIHLQSPGELGRSVSVCDPGEPYFQDIFGNNSPYVQAIEQADKLLGTLINHLKESKKWNETILMVSSDHGQSIVGWHPMLDLESSITPFVITGCNIAKGRELNYFEHTDIAPTIAELFNLEKPNNDGGSGQFIRSFIANISNSNTPTERQHLRIINEQIIRFHHLKSELTLASMHNPHFSVVLASLENEFLTPEPFYHENRITSWKKAESTMHLIDANELILNQIEKELEKR